MKKVLFLFGGNSSEHAVSCKSVKSIVEHVDKNSFDCELVGISKSNRWYIYEDSLELLEEGNWREGNCSEITNIPLYLKHFDVVFPMIHGAFGEDGRLQGFLEMLELPYVGCGVQASSICMDKGMCKDLCASLGIKQVEYVCIKDILEIDEVLFHLKFPMIVKPASGGSSIGIAKVENKEELEEAIKDAFRYDSKVVVEEFLRCRELECAILEKEGEIITTLPGEIITSAPFYDYETKYVNETITKIPDDLPISVVETIQTLARNIFKKLGCKDYVRIDFFYDETRQEIYLNEINTIPGFTTISMYPKLMESAGISYTELVTTLIENAD